MWLEGPSSSRDSSEWHPVYPGAKDRGRRVGVGGRGGVRDDISLEPSVPLLTTLTLQVTNLMGGGGVTVLENIHQADPQPY